MSFLFLPRRPLLTPLSIGLGLFATPVFRRSNPVLLDSFASRPVEPLPPARVPVFKNGRVNPDAYRQLSTGSVLGLFGGVVFATFSRMLALLFGLLLFGVQLAASKGYHLPMGRMQRYIKGVDIRSALHDNIAFKLSFGFTFMLAAFARF
jgi:uncharacterized membrane protein (Fun14 family)